VHIKGTQVPFKSLLLLKYITGNNVNRGSNVPFKSLLLLKYIIGNNVNRGSKVPFKSLLLLKYIIGNNVNIYGELRPANICAFSLIKKSQVII
jgi:hypothetical protein